MTDRELFEKALEALEWCFSNTGFVDPDSTMKNLRERLAQPIIKNYLKKDNSAQPQRTHWEGCEEVHPECRKPKQEPVAICEYCEKERPVVQAEGKPWVGLTDEAIWLEYQRFWPFHPAEEPTLAKDIAKFARAIEAKLREKNA